MSCPPIDQKSEVHPCKEAGALHPEDGDEDVGDKDEEDGNGYDVVQAVQTPLVGLLCDIPPSCNRRIHAHNNNKIKLCKNIFKSHIRLL